MFIKTRLNVKPRGNAYFGKSITVRLPFDNFKRKTRRESREISACFASGKMKEVI
jgi:hypothetical protein